MDLTTINTLWKPVYGKLVKAIRMLTPEWERLQRLQNFTQLSMRGINWPVELVNGGGIAFTSNGGPTARATSNAPVEATDTWKHLTGRFEVGFDELEAENDSKFASSQIEKQLRYQAADKARSFRRAIAVGFYGYPNAILFLTSTTGHSNPNGATLRLKVEDLYGIDGLMAQRIRDYLTVTKDKIAVIANPYTTPTIFASGIVTAASDSGDTIDISSAVSSAGVTAGMAIVLYNQVSGTVTDLNQGINGLSHLLRSTTVHGISETDQPDWTPGVRILNLGGILTGAKMYQWFTEIEQRSDYAPNFAYTTIGAIAAAGGPQLDQRRYGSDDDTLKLGFKELTVMGVKTEGRPYTPTGHLFTGNTSALRKLSPDEDVKDVTAGEKNGFKQYENTLGFYKDQVMRAQLTVVSRLGLGLVAGITEAA